MFRPGSLALDTSDPTRGEGAAAAATAAVASAAVAARQEEEEEQEEDAAMQDASAAAVSPVAKRSEESKETVVSFSGLHGEMVFGTIHGAVGVVARLDANQLAF
eukprot:GABV01003408.1.p1 GENE.GABV01003408.1~~GABV01003408.1.p1  ORF type:complete len:104 (+),score=43.52 GABV01003408.1:176-487(+)